MKIIRNISNAIIYDDEKILVVDKNKGNGRILTILPGGKVDEGETLEEALKREIHEELGIKNITILGILGDVEGVSPTSNIKSNIYFYKTRINNQEISTTAEVENPRYLSFDEILNLETTTDITQKIVNYLINKKNND